MGCAALRTLLPDSQAAQRSLLGGVTIPAPLMLPAPQQAAAGAVAHCTVDARTGWLEITSITAAGSRAVHVTGAAASLLPSRGSPAQPKAEGRRGVHLLPALAAPAGKPAVAGGLEVRAARAGFWMDPTPFDCFLQLGQVLMADDNMVYVPAGLGALHVAAELSNTTAAWAAVQAAGSDGAPVSNFHLASSSADPLCSISGLEAKSMGRSQAAAAAATKVPTVAPVDCLYQVAWDAAGSGAGEQLAAAGATIWHLPGSVQPPASAAASAIGAVQRLLKSGAAGAAVQLQTSGAALLPFLPPHGAALDKAAAALSGLVRTLNQECPQIGWSATDADSGAPTTRSAAAARLVQLAGPSDADAFGLAGRGNATFASSLARSAAQEALGAYHLMPMPRGSLNSLVPLPVDLEATLAPDQVVLAVRAVGLNFRYRLQLGAGSVQCVSLATGRSPRERLAKLTLNLKMHGSWL